MKILLVEDDKSISDLIKSGLESEKMLCDQAFEGEAGLDMACGNSYDVVILDWMLPGMSGVEILESLRDEKVETPVLMLTAKGEIEDKLEGFDAGSDDYLVKPFAFEELLVRVRALGKRKSQETSDT